MIRAQQIAHEDRVVRESLVGVLVHSQVERRGTAVAYVAKILLKIGAAESLDRFLGQLFEIGVSLVAQVEARQLVVPGAIREPCQRSPVDLLLLSAQSVLIQKYCQPFVEARVVRIAIDLAAEHGQCLGNLFQLHQAGQIAFQHSRILGRACPKLAGSRHCV